MASVLSHARDRIPSLPRFVRRALSDSRLLSYDLLPMASTPARRDALARLVAWFRPKSVPFAPSATARAWHRALETDGITPTLPLLPPETIAELRRYFETTACSDPYRPHLGRFRYDAPPSPESNMGYFAIEDTLAAPGLLALLNDPDVLAAAELYLGCKPMLDNLSCWWSFGDRPVAKGTQRYHRDLDSLRGFKLFIYLTDVDTASGPHVFMKGSHRSPLLDTGKAQSDADMRAAFGAENEVTMTGPAGTWFLADTFGFHKGALPITGRRLMVAAQYNVNRTPHLPRRPVARASEPGLDPYVNKLLVMTER
jgi:hypothetical protein